MNTTTTFRNILCLLLLGAMLAPRAIAEEHHQPGATAVHDAAEQAAKAPETEEDRSIRESLSQLSEEDRELAVAQGYCPVMADNRLGIMGPPTKVMVNDQPVFLCCAGCNRRAQMDPKKTLAIVETLKAKVEAAMIEANLASLTEEDRQLAVAQGYCPIMQESKLGTMGTPFKVMLADQPVFVCCKGCGKKAEANPQATLKVVAELQAKVTAAAEAAAQQPVAGETN